MVPCLGVPLQHRGGVACGRICCRKRSISPQPVFHNYEWTRLGESLIGSLTFLPSSAIRLIDSVLCQVPLLDLCSLPECYSSKLYLNVSPIRSFHFYAIR